MNALDHALQPLASIKLSRLPRATRLALEIFDRLDGGALAIELPDGLRLRAGHGPLIAHLRVRDHAVFDEALARGDIGFGDRLQRADVWGLRAGVVGWRRKAR